MSAKDFGGSNESGGLERFFALRAHKTNVRTEILAGATTFVTMVYIIFVNTNIMLGGNADANGVGPTGMDAVALTIGTILAAVIPTLVMGLWAKLPWALAPGLGYNALFAYTVILKYHLPYQAALTLVLLDGIAFTLLVIGPWRNRLISAIPLNLKLAAGAGIGLFIAFIGLSNAGIVKLQILNPSGLNGQTANVSDQTALPGLSTLNDPVVIVAIIGLILTGVMMAWRWRSALLIGIFLTTAIAWIAGAINSSWKTALGVTYPTGLNSFVQIPDFGRFFSKGFFQFSLNFGNVAFGSIFLFFLTFLVTDLMDSFGTFSGLATKLDILDDKGDFPRSGEALVTDATAGIWGPVVGTSTVATFIESAAGVGEGGKTGLTAVSTAFFFALCLLFVPLVGLIPPVATSPILIIVGFLMIEPVLKLNFRDITEGLPAFLTLLIMPLTYSIADGMFAGIESYVLLKLFTNRAREISLLMWGFAILLLLAKILQVIIS
ncbi:MAG TPA: NCS2 family permease [Chloroflexia bacterium]|nr:NCS2 family permease [Chloroflexia bacterium]